MPFEFFILQKDNEIFDLLWSIDELFDICETKLFGENYENAVIFGSSQPFHTVDTYNIYYAIRKLKHELEEQNWNDLDYFVGTLSLKSIQTIENIFCMEY